MSKLFVSYDHDRGVIVILGGLQQRGSDLPADVHAFVVKGESFLDHSFDWWKLKCVNGDAEVEV